MIEIIIRFAIGGLVVSFFALLGDLFKPKSFAGLFGAAPSVALASVGLTVLKHGHEYAAIEARSMILGAVAFLIYAFLVTQLLARWRWRALQATLPTLLVWLAAALGAWYVVLR